jgi:hypothetical protein
MVGGGSDGGRAFLENHGLTACAFCGRSQPLRLSQIIPKFVFGWLKRTSATGRLRVGYGINRPVQAGFKTRLREHVLRCRPDELPGPSPGVEATLRHFRVEPGPPDAA